MCVLKLVAKALRLPTFCFLWLFLGTPSGAHHPKRLAACLALPFPPPGAMVSGNFKVCKGVKGWAFSRKKLRGCAPTQIHVNLGAAGLGGCVMEACQWDGVGGSLASPPKNFGWVASALSSH